MNKRKIAKKEVEEKSRFVEMDEMIEIKALQLRGLKVSQIAKKVGRDRKTIDRSLILFETVLPDEVDMKNRVIDKFEEYKEQMMKNAKDIIFASDMQVMKKINSDDTTATDAAKIRQIYGNDFMRLSGIGGGGEIEDDGKSVKVQNFVTNIINIQSKEKDDTLKQSSGAKETTSGNERRGKETVVEGVVS